MPPTTLINSSNENIPLKTWRRRSKIVYNLLPGAHVWLPTTSPDFTKGCVATIRSSRPNNKLNIGMGPALNN